MGLHIMAGTPDAEANPGLRGMIWEERRYKAVGTNAVNDFGKHRGLPTTTSNWNKTHLLICAVWMNFLWVHAAVLQDRRKQAQRTLPPQPKITWNSALVRILILEIISIRTMTYSSSTYIKCHE